MNIGAATQRPIGDRAPAWIGLLLAGAAVQAGLWLVSEPAWLFDDFFKAYYRTAEILWREGPHPTWQLDEGSEVGFVNIPIVAALFVPLVFLGETGAGWAFLALGIAATAGAWALLISMARPETQKSARCFSSAFWSTARWSTAFAKATRRISYCSSWWLRCCFGTRAGNIQQVWCWAYAQSSSFRCCSTASISCCGGAGESLPAASPPSA